MSDLFEKYILNLNNMEEAIQPISRKSLSSIGKKLKLKKYNIQLSKTKLQQKLLDKRMKKRQAKADAKEASRKKLNKEIGRKRGKVIAIKRASVKNNGNVK